MCQIESQVPVKHRNTPISLKTVLCPVQALIIGCLFFDGNGLLLATQKTDAIANSNHLFSKNDLFSRASVLLIVLLIAFLFCVISCYFGNDKIVES